MAAWRVYNTSDMPILYTDYFCGKRSIIIIKCVRICITQLFYANWINDFIVEVPELPGCMADGSTAAEAIENSEIIITEWIETAVELGREIPEPKGRLMFA